MRTSNALGHTENPHILQDRSHRLVVSRSPPTSRHDRMHTPFGHVSFANIVLYSAATQRGICIPPSRGVRQGRTNTGIFRLVDFQSSPSFGIDLVVTMGAEIVVVHGHDGGQQSKMGGRIVAQSFRISSRMKKQDRYFDGRTRPGRQDI